MTKRILVFAYGAASYALFLGVFLYTIGFLGNLFVAKSINSSAAVPLAEALIVNFLLLSVFAVQHSLMARPTFKVWLTRFVPQPAERATYVLLSSLALALLFWQWRPMTATIWNVSHPIGAGVLWGLFALGWLTVLATTCLINHFDLFGLRQVWLYLRGKQYTPLGFVLPGPYKIVRHPLYVGWLLTFWATPTMSAGHLLFALTTTAYILVAIQLEERNLVEFHREYAAYRQRVPMLIPSLPKRRTPRGTANESV